MPLSNRRGMTVVHAPGLSKRYLGDQVSERIDAKVSTSTVPVCLYVEACSVHTYKTGNHNRQTTLDILRISATTTIDL